jgi:hypothetical protein
MDGESGHLNEEVDGGWRVRRRRPRRKVRKPPTTLQISRLLVAPVEIAELVEVGLSRERGGVDRALEASFDAARRRALSWRGTKGEGRRLVNEQSNTRECFLVAMEASSRNRGRKGLGRRIDRTTS